MNLSDKNELGLPCAKEIRQAIQIFLQRAYQNVPPQLEKFIPAPDADIKSWLMSAATERDPANAPLEQVRSFSIRLGNQLYPNMKLRLSRPPRCEYFVFTVDSHDAFLHAPPGSKDYEPLEELKKHNTALADNITAAWEIYNLPTERNYLRKKLQQARDRKGNQQ